MEIHKVSFSRERLMSLPENERVFFIQASNALNDISILHKQTLYASKIEKNEVLQKAQNSVAFFNLKVLAGKLLETWNMVRTGFLSSPEHRDYHSKLDDNGKDCLGKIRRYFSRQNLISDIRNKLAFHYDAEVIRNQLETPSPDEFEIFLSESQGNSLYFMPIVLEGSAIVNFVDSSDPENAFDTFFKDVLEMSAYFQCFLQNCLIVFLKRYFAEELEEMVEEIKIPDPPDIREVYSPFFVSKPFRGIIPKD